MCIVCIIRKHNFEIYLSGNTAMLYAYTGKGIEVGETLYFYIKVM